MATVQWDSTVGVSTVRMGLLSVRTVYTRSEYSGDRVDVLPLCESTVSTVSSRSEYSEDGVDALLLCESTVEYSVQS
jgi:hypothetical protein